MRAELNSLMQNPKCSAADKLRLQQHFDAIRDTENDMMDMGSDMATVGCTLDGIDTSAYQALSTWKYNSTNVANGGIEQRDCTCGSSPLAFAVTTTNGNAAWGDGTDHTCIIAVDRESATVTSIHQPSNQSDGAVGSSHGRAAHAEIDAVRMKTLASSLKHFADRGLQKNTVVAWTNHVAEGGHSMRNVPFILWGSAGGALKQGHYVDAGGASNGQLFNNIITAATGNTSPNFGSSAGKDVPQIKA